MTGIPTIDAYKMPTSAQMPGNVASWRFDAERAVLLVHDMQRYFVDRLPTDGLGDVLVANATALKARCLQSHAPVAYTMQPGSMTTEQRGLLRDFWGTGMQSSIAERDVVDGLAPADDDWLITKWRYSAFFGSDLLARMRAAKRDQLIICGVYAHIGVLMTAVEAFSNDVQTFVVADAIADFSLERHLMALQYAADCCAVVLTTGEIIRG